MTYTLEELKRKNFAELKQIADELNVFPEGDRRCRQNWIDAIAGVNPPLLQLLQLLEVSPAGEVQAQEPSIETVEHSPGVGVEPVQEAPLDSKFGRIVYPKQAAKPIAQNEEARPQLDRAQSADVHNLGSHPTKSDRDSSGTETEALGSEEGDRVLAVARHCETGRGRVLPDQSTKLVNFTEAEQLENQTRTSQSAIAPAAKNSPGVEADYSPAVTGITFSHKFLATYPPYFGEIHYKADCTGQLNLLESAETENEPPDPDDFESLDAFRDAIARWDWEHPTSSFDHCSDLLPSSVQNEPSSVQNELPLQVSLDSFCLWAHCPDDWYEPVVLLEPSPTCKSSITSDFFIPTFGSLGNRSNRSDEPPDTWIFARLPKPKPPKFPPQAASQPLVNQVSRNYPETIPKLFHRVAAGSSTQPARSPPGGDAMS
jgi:hypothetical protein